MLGCVSIALIGISIRMRRSERGAGKHRGEQNTKHLKISHMYLEGFYLFIFLSFPSGSYSSHTLMLFK